MKSFHFKLNFSMVRIQLTQFCRVVLGSGKFEEIMVASQEIAGSTAQLVIASRVKAREGSDR